MTIEIIFLGLLIGFIYYELVGYSPGGVITPGYLAITVYDPSKIVVTIILGVIVYWAIDLLTRHTILYGRRKFLLALLIGVCLKIAVDRWIQPLPFVQFDLSSVGYIIPGLIGLEMTRQKIVPTISGIVIVSVIIALVLLLFR
jgi:poly-gamma-glutamate biosynthesis protein PgsC/CapC